MVHRGSEILLCNVSGFIICVLCLVEGLKAAKWETLVSAAGLNPAVFNTCVHSIKFGNVELMGNRGRWKEKVLGAVNVTPKGPLHLPCLSIEFKIF